MMDLQTIQTVRGMTAPEWAGVAVAYALGCFATGYYWVRWRTGKDLRTEGSGNVGAKNAGRLLGSTGFAVVCAGDAAKAVLAMGMARFFDFQVLALTLVMLAVVAGHIWPVQLGFSGGKGIVTSIAGLVLFHWQLALGMLGAGMIVYGFLKRFTLSGLCAFAAAPAIAIAFGLDGIRICGVAILSVMVLLAHRSNLVEEIAGKKKSGPLKTVKVH